MSRRRRRKIDRQTKHQLTVEALSHEGRGIARVDGKTTFVFAGLPGEEVLVQYRAKYKQYDEVEVCEVITASPDRVTPICPAFGRCGGCTLQHMAPADQIKMKENVFRELLQQHAGALPEQWWQPLTGPTAAYRRKARLSAREVPKKNTVMLGFRERDGRYVADITECPILVKTMDENLAGLRELLYTMPEKAKIPQIEVSVGDMAAIIVRHLEPLAAATIAKFTEFCAQHNWWLYLQPGNETTVHKVYPQDENFNMTYSLADFGLKYAFHPSGFIQVNETINNKMLHQGLAILDLQATDKVLDLFCGIGNISLPLAQQAAQVVGVEAAVAAVEQAKVNAQANNITNAEFYVGDLFKDCSQDAWAKQQYDVLVLDPPRAGAKEILELLPQFAAQKILYISCHPMSLARDIAIIRSYGYKFVQAGVMDMFPHTQHVESMAYFVKD